MKKNFILRLLLLVAVSISIHSCRSEDIYQENERQKQDLRASVLRFHEISSNAPLLQKVQQLQSELFSSSGILGKNNSVLDGATISTDKVILVENGTQKTYTFPVKRNSESKGLENLVLKQNADGTFSGVLIQYDITPLEKDLFVLGEEVDMKNKIKVYEINDLSISQKIVTEAFGCFIITWENGVCGSGQHGYGDGSCQLTGSGAAPAPGIISIVNTCSGGAGGENTGIPNYPDPNSPGGNTGGYNTLPYSDDSDMMLLKYQQFSNVFHINTYGFPTALRTKLFYLYLYQNEDEYIVSKLLSTFGTKPDILNGAVDLFTQNSNLTWEEFYNQFMTNPCAKLKAQNNDATFKAKIDYLKTKTGESFEYGFRVNNPPPGQTAIQYQQLSNVVGSNTIDFKFFNTTYGYMHSHFERLIPIFSPDDINTFIKLLINAHNNNIPQENVFMNVVNPDGTIYQLRGDDINVGSLTIYEQNIIDKELNNIYVNDYKLGEPNQSPEFYQENFLKFMKDNMNINGAKMYSIDNNGKASQLSLNGNSLDNSIPCPN